MGRGIDGSFEFECRRGTTAHKKTTGFSFQHLTLITLRWLLRVLTNTLAIELELEKET